MANVGNFSSNVYKRFFFNFSHVFYDFNVFFTFIWTFITSMTHMMQMQMLLSINQSINQTIKHSCSLNNNY